MMSACGVMCSECPAYLGAARGIEHQRQTVDAWHRIYGLRETPDAISCGGCLGPDDQLFHTMGHCEARRCCRAKGFGSCAECAVEGCPALERAQAVWDSVPGLAGTLSAADFDRYARPYCGHRERLTALRAAQLPPSRGGRRRGSL
jgi:hypothetical protein